MKLKFASIGTSSICSMFIEAALKSDKYELVAVYSRNEETGRAFAKKHGIQKVFTDLNQLSESKEFDVVYIASPNSMHFEQTIRMLQNKKHVICEKPIFSTVRELEEAFQIAEENRVYLFEAIRNIHDPNFIFLKNEIEKVGTIQNVMLQYCQYSSRYDKFIAGEEPNVFSRKLSGGALVDLGVYPINLAIGLFGKPKDFLYHATKLRNGIDGAGTLVLKYDGFNCTIIASKISAGQTPSEIQGVNGSIVLNDTTTLTELMYVDRKTSEVTKLEGMKVDNNMIYEASVIADAISTRDNEKYQYCKKLSRTVLQITEKSRHQNDIYFEVEN
ncbi:MAG: oxidoreductase domain protein [Bacillales bacterium]|jgi:predicted dehydrogenase|nr:oxidoreductase domain protein [Bacillales bacterium]